MLMTCSVGVIFALDRESSVALPKDEHEVRRSNGRKNAMI